MNRGRLPITEDQVLAMLDAAADRLSGELSVGTGDTARLAEALVRVTQERREICRYFWAVAPSSEGEADGADRPAAGATGR
jgi:hypothetical protein